MQGRLVEKARDFRGTARKLIAYMRPYHLGLIIVIALNIVSVLLWVAGPKIIGFAVDILYEGVAARVKGAAGAGVDFHALIRILVWLIVIYLTSALLQYIQEYKLAGIAQRMMRRMRDDVSGKLHRLPLSYYDTRTYGEILSRVTNDIDTINTTLGQNMSQIIWAVVMLGGITVMMLTVSPLLSLVAFLLLPLGVFITTFVAKRSQKHFNGQQTELGEMSGLVEEMYAGQRVVKAFNYEQKSIDDFERINRRLYEHGWRAQFVTGVIYPTLNFVSNLAFVGICVLGGSMVTVGRLSLGAVQAFITYSRQFNQPIMQVANLVTLLQSTMAAAERVFDILEEKEEVPESAQPVHLENPEWAVRFDHISFRYNPHKPLIEDLSIDVKPGQLIAIVGPTGAGKTTLVNLLMRFYELDGGAIRIDGVNITDMKRKDLHKLFGMVLQDTWLFSGTIRQNIAYGKPHATDEEVERAAKIALADPFIRMLPHGYDTIIDEEGGNISQGQKQLLTIARAVISDPPIMILDEATSSVDTRTETLIQEAMARLMKGRTSFVIAHRLSTIRDADNILVINKGSVVESGTHEELLRKHGFYAELLSSSVHRP